MITQPSGGWTVARVLAAAAVTATLAFGAVSCGGENDANTSPGGPSATAAAGTDGSSSGASASNGEQLSRSMGCAGCHGQNFEGGAGPTWVGLAGSTVTLADGSTTVADDAYLTRAIKNPSADLAADYTLKMPANNLSDAEIADIVAFINTMGEG